MRSRKIFAYDVQVFGQLYRPGQNWGVHVMAYKTISLKLE